MEYNKLTIGDLLYIKGRIGWKGLKKSEYLAQGNYRIINGKSVTEKGVNWDECGYISKERYLESPEIMLENGDIVITKDGTIGKIGLITNLKTPTTIASGLFLLRNTRPDLYNTLFIYYFLKSPYFKQFIGSRTEGSVIPHLYQRDFNQLSIPKVKLKTQNQIVQILYSLDKKIELNNEVIANLEELSQTLFKRWFIDFEFPDENGNPYKSSGGQLTDSELGFIPQGWSIRTIDQVAEFINGYAFKSKDLIKKNPGDYLHVFKMGHIKRGGGLKYDGTKDYYPKDIPEKLNKYILKRGDILMSMTDMKSNVAILGHTALMDQDDKYIVNQRVGLLRILDKAILDYPYLYILTNTSEFINELRKKANSGVQVNLSSAVIKKELMILPSAKVHKEFNDIAKNYYQQIFNLSRENEHLKTLRDILLPKLMTGEIELPDELEVDEHAELLQRG